MVSLLRMFFCSVSACEITDEPTGRCNKSKDEDQCGHQTHHDQVQWVEPAEVLAVALASADAEHPPGHSFPRLQERVMPRFALLSVVFFAIFCHATQLLDAMLQIVQAITPITKARRHRAVLRFLRRCSGVMVMLISLPGVSQRCGRAPAKARSTPDRLHLPTAWPEQAHQSCAMP